MPTTLPTEFGRYRILRLLGEGGMGAVYLAEDTGPLRRQVALKVPHFTEAEDRQAVERFYREARIAASIHHPNLCPVYEVGCINGVHYLAMAYLEGNPLSRYVGPSRPWPPDHAVIVMRQIAGVLHLLHQRGIIHRDLKPANIMIQTDGTPVLMDFGLARAIDGDSQRITRTGQSLGTPAFMAPEQITAAEDALGPHTDVWALGVILYQLLTGQLPFQGTAAEVVGRILAAQPPPPSSLRPGINPALDSACLRAMSKDPRKRPASAQAFTAMLSATDQQATQALTADPEMIDPGPPSTRDVTQHVARPTQRSVRTAGGVPRRRPTREADRHRLLVPMILAGGALLLGALVLVLVLALRDPTPSTPSEPGQSTALTTPTSPYGAPVLPDPGTLSHLREQTGNVYYFEVTGTSAAWDYAWGTDVYTDDSRLSITAVHAGALKVGEKGVVKVTILSGRNAYEGSTRNGITTSAYGPWSGSYRVERARP